MTASASLIRNIVYKLILGQDYRSEVVALVDAQFLEYAIDFFKRVAEPKCVSSKLPSTGINAKCWQQTFRKSKLLATQTEHQNHQHMYTRLGEK